MISELERIDSALLVEHRVAMKPGGDELVHRRIFQHVSGKLLDRELIIGHVLVERPDNPVPIGPDRAGTIFLIAIRIGIASQIEPVPSPALAIGG